MIRYHVLLLLWIMLAFIKPAFALSVDSMVKIAKHDSRGVTFIVQGSDQNRKIEAECYMVSMDHTGKETLSVCDEKYVIYPPIFDLAAQQKRAIRISNLSEKNQHQEVALRIFFGELPSPQQQPGVELLSRLGCWLFFQPSNIVIQVQAHISNNQVTIDNQSNVHLRPISGEIITKDGNIDISEILKQTPRILAHHQRILPLPSHIFKQLRHDTIKEIKIILDNGYLLRLPLS